MKYCSECGHPVEKRIPDGDDRIRHCCPSCDTIHYHNPRIIVGCLPVWEDKILLCKRGIDPRLGYWTLPAGFMELGESTEEGAIRETWEESRAEVKLHGLHGIYNIPLINQVYFIYLANMTSDHFETTPESTEIRLFEKEDIPWEQLAFKVVTLTLKDYFSKSEGTENGVYHKEIDLSHLIKSRT